MWDSFSEYLYSHKTSGTTSLPDVITRASSGDSIGTVTPDSVRSLINPENFSPPSRGSTPLLTFDNFS